MNNIRSITSNICIFLVFFITINVNALENNDNCQTPNGEIAKCIPITSCRPLIEAVQSRNRQSIRFVQQSQCGYATTPLVCCGTYSSYIASPYDDLFDIFGDVPYIKTPEQAKQELESEILRSYNTKTLPDKTVCGLERKKRQDSQGGKEETDFDEYPWTVILQYKNKAGGSDAGSICGGSLINNLYVLTAASCLVQNNLELTSVRLGDWNLTSENDCQQVENKVIATCKDRTQQGNAGIFPSPLQLDVNSRANLNQGRRRGTTLTPDCQDVKVENSTIVKCTKAEIVKVKEVFVHPFYNQDTGNNNIGLIKLATDVRLTDYIRPVCLPPQSSQAPSRNTAMTVAGWGFRENKPISNIKLQTAVTLIDLESCKSKTLVAPYQLCATNLPAKSSGSQGGRRTQLPTAGFSSTRGSSCRGDMGGLIVKPNDEKVLDQIQWSQEGILTSGCSAGSDSPLVYTRVSRYINWILKIIGEVEEK